MISVSGEGRATAMPDIAKFDIEVQTSGKTAQSTMQQNNERMNGIFSLLEKYKIPEKDKKTTGVNLHPKWKHYKDRESEIVGYQASNCLNIKIRNFDQIDELVGELIESGCDVMDGPYFEIDDKSSLENTARKEAVKNAIEKASLYCESAGLKLGDLCSLVETNFGNSNHIRALSMEAAQAESVPTAGGEQSVVVNINAEFEILKGENNGQSSSYQKA